MWPFVIILLILAMGCQGFCGERVMINGETERVKRFKSLIGYEEALKGLNQNEGVVCEWPDPSNWEGLKGSLWKIYGETLRAERAAVTRRWFLRQQEQTLLIEIFVSSGGPRLPAEYLLKISSSSTLPEIPFTKGPRGLGQLAIQFGNGEPKILIWTFYNVCFRIQQMEHKISILPLARWMQNLAEKHLAVPLGNYMPKVDKVDVSANRIRVGETVTIKVHPIQGQNPDRLLLEVGAIGDALDLIMKEGFSVGLNGKKPGQGDLEIIVADKKNLLCSPILVRVEIVEGDKK
jgi:hypothetical protein